MVRTVFAMGLSCLVWILPVLAPATANAQELHSNPLSPPDLSTPTATIQTFIAEMEAAIAAYGRGNFEAMRRHAERLFQTFAIELPPNESGFILGVETALYLFEILIRVELPPTGTQAGQPPAEATDISVDEPSLPVAWRLPGTEIVLERQADQHTAEVAYRFTEATLLRVQAFFHLAQTLPVKPDYRAYAGIAQRFHVRPGFAAPMAMVSLVHALPREMLVEVAGEPVWKWITLLIGLVLASLIFMVGYRLAGWLEGGGESEPRRAIWARPLMLASAIMAVIFLRYVVIDVIRLTGPQLEVANGLLAIVGHGAFIWLIFLVAVRAANAVIAIRDMGVQSLDTQLVLLVAKVLAVLLSLYALINLADVLSIPVAPMIAGLGVGGLAVALAVRPTLENAVAGFVLFADKPVRIGEFCAFGDKLGTVEQIGLRSVQVRGLDRTVITIPNAEFSQMQITNFSRRDSNLFQTMLGLRYETSTDQLRLVLVRLRELLVRHPMVSMEPARVRFVGYGDFALKVEMFAFVQTRDWGEFLAVQEDLNLRIKDIVEAAGTGFAFPSQTLYMERGQGLQAEAIEKAEAQVERWREEDRLPFPDHEAGFRFELANTLDYPPAGSAGARRPREVRAAAE